MDKGGCLVTVGTTRFDQLIVAASKREFAERLRDMGFRWLRLQVGRGPEPEDCGQIANFSRSWFRLTPDMPAEMQKANLIISHGGAGSIMEALCLRKTLVVCVNDALMGNHQRELAVELHKRRHLILSTPGSLGDAVSEATSDSTHLIPYPEYDPLAFPKLVDAEMCTARTRSIQCALS